MTVRGRNHADPSCSARNGSSAAESIGPAELRWLASCVMGACIVATTCGCDPRRDRPPGRQVPGGDPGRGREALVAYGCGSCHVIPGVDAAIGLAAPPLDRFAERGFVGGVLPNNAENLVAWIVDPRAISPLTAMPNLGVREADARDMAAYLYTLRAER